MERLKEMVDKIVEFQNAVPLPPRPQRRGDQGGEAIKKKAIF